MYAEDIHKDDSPVVVDAMNGRWGAGAPLAPPAPAPSSQRRQVCDEARAAAAWLWVQSEVAQAFERFSKDLQAIHGRGLNAAATLERDASFIPGNKGAARDPSAAGCCCVRRRERRPIASLPP